MAFVITQSCCNDTLCVDVCPVGCIHPDPSSAAYATTEQLYIDPAKCIDCEACYEVCPVDAIYPDHALPMRLQPYLEINAGYFDGT